ncbi:MAG: hypothetical protein ABI255_06305 [Microbacteriaceae bacterium]
MAQIRSHTGSRRIAANATLWLDTALLPIFGPPPLGPFDAEEPRTPEHNLCPLCGNAMPMHEVEHEGVHTFLHCPGRADGDQLETGRAA